MRRLSIVIAVLGFGSVAHAEHINDVQLTLDEDHATITVIGASGAGTPRIWSTNGMIRARFADVGHSRISVRGDGSVFRWLRVRAGVAESAVLQIRLMDRRRLDTSLIELTERTEGLAIRIPRSALPAPDASLEPEPSPAADVELEEDDIDLDAESDAETESAPEQPMELATDIDGATAAPIEQDSGIPYTLLILITALLGIAHLVIRWLTKSRRKLIEPEINVIASKRIGTRTQLMVVRALGEDHLLSVQGGQTQILASMPIDADKDDEDAAPKLSLFKEKLRESLPPEAPASVRPFSGPLPEDERFGSGLLKLAERRRDSIKSTQRTDAVAGLLALRARAGK